MYAMNDKGLAPSSDLTIARRARDDPFLLAQVANYGRFVYQRLRLFLDVVIECKRFVDHVSSTRPLLQ
jgi:hypothetical protein